MRNNTVQQSEVGSKSGFIKTNQKSLNKSAKRVLRPLRFVIYKNAGVTLVSNKQRKLLTWKVKLTTRQNGLFSVIITILEHGNPRPRNSLKPQQEATHAGVGSIPYAPRSTCGGNLPQHRVWGVLWGLIEEYVFISWFLLETANDGRKCWERGASNASSSEAWAEQEGCPLCKCTLCINKSRRTGMWENTRAL